MSRKTLNLGILAHVDAGKTTLTERLLYAAGAIEEIGSVDDGTTQTDSLNLERQRGITIKSAVVVRDRRRRRQSDRHVRPPRLHRRGGARVERARRRPLGDLGRRAAADPIADAGVAPPAHAHAPVREQDRPSGGSEERVLHMMSDRLRRRSSRWDSHAGSGRGPPSRATSR
jgi:hypothetical protein